MNLGDISLKLHGEWFELARIFRERRVEALRAANISPSHYWPAVVWGVDNIRYDEWNYIKFEDSSVVYVVRERDGETSEMSVPFSILEGTDDMTRWINKWIEGVVEEHDRRLKQDEETTLRRQRREYERLKGIFEK